MPAGQLRDRITFQREAISDEGGGGGPTVWSNVCTVWGGLRLEKGRERIEAGRLDSVVAGVLTVRDSGVMRAITVRDRAVIRGVVWNIRSNENEDRHLRMRAMVVERGVAT